MNRGAVASISASSLRYNLSVVRQVAPNSLVMAVVKTNAYGFGVQHVLPSLAGADGFAVATVQEGVALRELGIVKPVLALQGVMTQEELMMASLHNIQLVVHQVWQVGMLEQIQGSLTQPIGVWLKVNTGMNRLGVAQCDALICWQRLTALPNVELEVLMTHLACADEALSSSPHLVSQLSHFEACEQLIKPAKTSIANSAAIFRHPSTRTDWVRPGIALYGGLPCAVDAAESLKQLRPVMSLSAPVISVQFVEPGSSIGYGATYSVPQSGNTQPRRIAVVGIGYGDGFPRHIDRDQAVYLNGRYCTIVGRVSMDMITVDVTDAGEVSVGDSVELWGSHVSIDAIAHGAGTIGYELFCQLTQRVQRVVVQDFV